jgi:hypothetical protein
MFSLPNNRRLFSNTLCFHTMHPCCTLLLSALPSLLPQGTRENLNCPVNRAPSIQLSKRPTGPANLLLATFAHSRAAWLLAAIGWSRYIPARWQHCRWQGLHAHLHGPTRITSENQSTCICSWGALMASRADWKAGQGGKPPCLPWRRTRRGTSRCRTDTGSRRWLPAG